MATVLDIFAVTYVVSDPKVWRGDRSGNLVVAGWVGLLPDFDELDRVLRRLCHIVPPVLIYFLLPLAFPPESGMVAFVLVTWLSSHDLFRRIEFGLVASSVASLIAFWIALRHKLRTGATPTHGSMMDAIIDMPFES